MVTNAGPGSKQGGRPSVRSVSGRAVTDRRLRGISLDRPTKHGKLRTPQHSNRNHRNLL